MCERNRYVYTWEKPQQIGNDFITKQRTENTTYKNPVDAFRTKKFNEEVRNKGIIRSHRTADSLTEWIQAIPFPVAESIICRIRCPLWRHESLFDHFILPCTKCFDLAIYFQLLIEHLYKIYSRFTNRFVDLYAVNSINTNDSRGVNESMCEVRFVLVFKYSCVCVCVWMKDKDEWEIGNNCL